MNKNTKEENVYIYFEGAPIYSTIIALSVAMVIYIVLGSDCSHSDSLRTSRFSDIRLQNTDSYIVISIVNGRESFGPTFMLTEPVIMSVK